MRVRVHSTVRTLASLVYLSGPRAAFVTRPYVFGYVKILAVHACVFDEYMLVTNAITGDDIVSDLVYVASLPCLLISCPVLENRGIIDIIIQISRCLIGMSRHGVSSILFWPRTAYRAFFILKQQSPCRCQAKMFSVYVRVCIAPSAVTQSGVRCSRIPGHKSSITRSAMTRKYGSPTASLR